MALVVVSPSNVVNFPDGGGHFWVYMQYAHGLRQLGCDVYWLERVESPSADGRDYSRDFREQMARFGFAANVILYSENDGKLVYQGLSETQAEAIFRTADLLLNFHYAIHPALLSRFRRTALVDIDPGLLQFWISTGQLEVAPHDVYFTIGETVGTPSALFPDCGLKWIHIRPPVCLDLWPFINRHDAESFTTVSSWWGDEWITDGSTVYENNKRVTFMNFARLARLTDQPLELAICDGPGDVEDLRLLKEHGWRVRHSAEVAGTPEMYRAYIQGSRGEFSCAKPSCMKFQNAWISDRTLCYMASGKPAVVQNTGPSAFLPDGDGLFRFSTLEEAVASFETINTNYEKHCRAARGIVEACFEASPVIGSILRSALQ